MSREGEIARKRGELVEALLQEALKLPDMLFVMGKGPQAVMEAWVDSAMTRVGVKDDWIAVESESWHCHLHLAEITHIRFVEEPDVHDPKRQAYSIRFLGVDESPLLMIFFGKMYDASGLIFQERAGRFRALQKKYVW